ncbi:hypothetical protein PLICRDRAFT_41416 [Plicaturopsis crispa FD-325 SS-3]|nr:hypothetical protein PLICRDRAFT_41416 [Plicaturopsis crispa FD-325 SS-3]
MTCSDSNLFPKCHINSLPVEILARIFEETRHVSGPENDPEHEDDQYTAPPFPIPLCHITKYWSEVAIATSSLWTSIDSETCRPYLSLYLERSRQQCLNIEATLLAGDLSAFMALFMNRIIEHVARWRTLTVRASFDPSEGCDDFVVIVGSLEHLAAPRLEMLSFTACDNVGMFREDVSVYPANIFTGGAPALQSVVIQDVPPGNCLPPLASVTHLGMSNLRVSFGGRLDTFVMRGRTDNLRAAFAAAHSLESLTMNWVAFDVVPDGPIHIPSLRCLDIRAFTNSGPNNLDSSRPTLRSIHAPGLQELKISDCTINVLPPIFDFIRSEHMFPGLRSLSIHFLIKPPPSPIPASIFDATPNIEELSILGADAFVVLQDLVGMMTSTDRLVWPNLHALELYCHASALVNGDLEVEPMLRELIADRVDRGKPIHRLAVFPGILSHGGTLRIQELCPQTQLCLPPDRSGYILNAGRSRTWSEL